MNAPLAVTLPYKRCGCGRVYSHAEWCELDVAKYQLVADEILELRTCGCRSTICVTLTPEQYLRSLATLAGNKNVSDVERQLAGSLLADAVLRYVRVGVLPEGQTPEDDAWLTEEMEIDDALGFHERRDEPLPEDADLEAP